MRHPVIDSTLPTTNSPLETVLAQFEAWRKRRGCRSRIPEALWQAAAALCRDRSICEVSRALRLNYNDLKHRVQGRSNRGLALGRQGPELGFVKLDLGTPLIPSEYLVEMEAPSGSKMRMSFRGVLREVDPVELSRAFWRQGR
jgi:hypothetical protein